MAAALNVSKIIRRVRQRLQISQEGLSQHLNATKGAVQHWERGRNQPDLARLFALRQICPPGAERKELDALIKRTQRHIAPLPGTDGTAPLGRAYIPPAAAGMGNLEELRKENLHLKRQVDRLQATLRRRAEQLQILKDLAANLQREKAEQDASSAAKAGPSQGSSAKAAD